jgi:hypothetical protein
MIKNPKVRNGLYVCVIAGLAAVAPMLLLLSMFGIAMLLQIEDIEPFALLFIPISYLVFKSKRSDFFKATYLVFPLTAVFFLEVWKIFGKLEDIMSNIMSYGLTYAVIGLEILFLIFLFRKRNLPWMYYFAVFCVTVVLLFNQLFLPPM